MSDVKNESKSDGFKILIVDDNELFRKTLAGCLEKKKYLVSQAVDGSVAKEIILLDKFDLIISDIQMPHFSGLDLLQWVKERQKTPVVLMTGFSQALETKKAHDLGADDFLVKPFKDAELQEIVLKFVNAGLQPKEKVAEDLDPQFCKVSVENFISEKETEHTIYLRISKSKFIKLAHKGGKLSDDRIKTYKDKGILNVYVKKEDFAQIVAFNIQVAKVLDKSTSISNEKKMSFMKHASDLVLEHAFVTGVDNEAFQESKSFIETSMKVLTDDSEMFSLLNALSTQADFIYAHSLGVSTFSVMIAKQLGWTAPQTLFKIGLGGLLHDIGKKELEKVTLEKPRALLNQKERTSIESHTTRGKEILETVKSVPSEVIAIAYQHHENILGTGYPRGIGRNEIHPLAKVVQVANIFCEYTVKHTPGIEPISAADALAKMEAHKIDEMDKGAFKALTQLFKK
jgi:putative nucleotidyltransferase with HDIG domain